MSEIENIEIDYTQLEVSEIIDHLKALKGQSNILAHEDQITMISTSFYAMLDEEKELALSRFVEDGGVKEGFEYRLDQDRKESLSLINELKDLIKTSRSNKKELFKKNQKKKEFLIEELRAINESSDLGNKNLNRVKTIQEEWRASDPVPAAVNNLLWPSYKGLLDIFYANRKLTFNLKDLDRERNLEEKKVLCEKAEALAKTESINEGSIILNDLHKQYKSLGPVPEEQSEAIWERFKAATDVFHEKRDAFMEEFKQKLNENLILKIELLEKYKTFMDSLEGDVFWKDAIKSFEDLESQWKSIGKVPNDKVTGLNNVYWSFVKTFLKKKASFYKELDSLRGESQKVKDTILEELNTIVSSEDFLGLKNKVLDLQKKWWDSGAVPKKVAKEYNTKFRSICDSYFEKVRVSYDEKDKEFENNLVEKKELIKAFVDEVEDDAEQAYNKLKASWSEIGEVARKKVSQIEKAIDDAIEKVSNLKSDEDKKEQVRSNLEMLLFVGHPNADRLIADKIQELRKQITHDENELTNLQTNKAFFGRSKNADKILKDFDDKITDLEMVIEKNKAKVQVLRKK